MTEKAKPQKPPKSMIRAELNTTLGADILRQAADNISDRPRLLRIISDFAQKWEKEVFATQGGATGRRWKPLARSTGGQPLVRSGVLRDALTGLPRKMKASVQLRGPDYAKYLKGGRYAPKSKTGTGRRSGVEGLGGSMPRRNPAPRPPKERLAILTGDLLSAVDPEG